MKKLLTLFLVVALSLSVTSCISINFGNPENNETTQNTDEESDTDKNEEDEDEEEDTAKKSVIPPSPSPEPEIKTLTITGLDELMSGLEFKVISSAYIVQDERYKALYPDMLQAIVQNDTEYDIKNAVVAFVAWDENNLPVKIKGKFDFGESTYIKKCNYNDINLIPGATFGEEQGMQIDETCNISSVKAYVLSYETFEGEMWKNPYESLIEDMYKDGIKYSEDYSIETDMELPEINQ